MAHSLMAVHLIGITITIFFFLFTLVLFIFISLAILSSKPIESQTGNLMILALIPPSILTVIFLRMVLGAIYDRLFNLANRLSKN